MAMRGASALGLGFCGWGAATHSMQSLNNSKCLGSTKEEGSWKEKLQLGDEPFNLPIPQLFVLWLLQPAVALYSQSAIPAPYVPVLRATCRPLAALRPCGSCRSPFAGSACSPAFLRPLNASEWNAARAF